MHKRIARMTRLFSLRPGELVDLVRAQWELLAVRIYLRRHPTGELVKIAAGANTAPSVGATESQIVRARSLALAVERAAEFGLFRATCLPRATAIQRLLNRDGIPGSQVRIGVRNGRNGFEAHAWVEMGETLLGDLPQHVGTFAVANDLRVVNS